MAHQNDRVDAGLGARLHAATNQRGADTLSLPFRNNRDWREAHDPDVVMSRQRDRRKKNVSDDSVRIFGDKRDRFRFAPESIDEVRFGMCFERRRVHGANRLDVGWLFVANPQRARTPRTFGTPGTDSALCTFLKTSSIIRAVSLP